jgi:hypothetical protein
MRDRIGEIPRDLKHKIAEEKDHYEQQGKPFYPGTMAHKLITTNRAHAALVVNLHRTCRAFFLHAATI